MPHIEFDLETELAPSGVVAALTDFSENRPEIWGDLSREHYEVYEVGDTSADVREGSHFGPLNIWAREYYDWSRQGVVEWKVTESNFCRPGSYVRINVEPRERGGSKIHTTWERTPTTMSARIQLALVKLSRGKPIADSLKRGFDKYEQKSS